MAVLAQTDSQADAVATWLSVADQWVGALAEMDGLFVLAGAAVVALVVVLIVVSARQERQRQERIWQ